MLLRRITKHVTDQNWFAVFIDFLIVVVGVFIGIQVTNWNAQRIEQSLEESYLERLKSNITESRDNTKRTTTRWIERNSYLNIVVNSLENCSLSDDDKAEFAEGIYHLGKFELAYFNDSAIEEMKSTGRLAIISNAELLDSIAGIERSIMYQSRVGPIIISRISPHVDYAYQRVRFQTTSIEDLRDEGKVSDSAIYSFDELCKDAAFIASVSAVRDGVFQMMEWNDRIASDMDETVQLLEAELAKQ